MEQSGGGGKLRVPARFDLRQRDYAPGGQVEARLSGSESELILNLDSFKGNEFYSFGHIGAPTIHAYAFIPTKDIPNEVKKAVTLEVREKTEALNVKYGGCGGEWGLTAQRAGFLEKKYGPVYTADAG